MSLILVFSLATGGLSEWGSRSERIVPFGRASFTTTGTLTNALIANIPQLFLSISYFFFNSVCTAMAAALEWNAFAMRRKGLRVSKPSNSQRDTYFLQLPYKFGIPLAAMSGLMHWLLSQSFFLVRQEYREADGSLLENLSKSACGMSNLSFLILMIVYLCLYALFFVFACTRIRARIPFAASCSLVYSAACHPPLDDVDAHLRPVQWGEVVGTPGSLPHCTITSREVTVPTPQSIYR